MKVLHPTIGLERLCKLFGKTRQGYYDHSRRASDEQLQQIIIIKLVINMREILPKTGGHKLLFMLKDDLQHITLRLEEILFQTFKRQ